MDDIVFITTLRSPDGEHFFVDISVEANGYVSRCIGPTDHRQAQRFERHLLLHYKVWRKVLTEPDGAGPCFDEMLHSALEHNVTRMLQDCELADSSSQQEHDRWMADRPLPTPPSLETLQ